MKADPPAAYHDTLNHDSKPSSPSEPPASSIAHLVPDSHAFASLYYHVAIWVFGGNSPNYEPKVVQKLIHGSKPGNGDRVARTGLKHMVCNKIRLAGHGEHFDRNPRVLIVPVLSLQQAKEWNGQGYDAIVMISDGIPDNADQSVDLQYVAADLHFLDLGAVASPSETELARELLTATVKGLAFSFVEGTNEEEQPWVKELSEESRKELKNLRDASSLFPGKNLILIPKEQNGPLKPVRKITFSPALDSLEDGHPAPDPLLLAVRAGLNWSAFHEQRLMPRRQDDDSDMCELSILAMEEHLAMVENYERARRDEEIMSMTINLS